MRRAMLTATRAPGIVDYEAFSVGTTASGTSVSTDNPAGAGLGAGKLVIAKPCASAARTWNVPGSGFARLPSISAGANADAFYKILDGSEGATFAFTQTGAATTLRVDCVLIGGTHGTTPIESASFQQTGGATSNAIPQVTVTAGTVLFSMLNRIGSTATVVKPGSMIQDYQDNTAQSMAGASEAATPGSGVTGTRTWMWTGTSASAGLLVSLVPS